MNAAFGSVTPVIGAVIAQARKRIVNYFLVQHALGPDQAVAYQPQKRMEKTQFRHMLAKGVIREAGEGRYWLDRYALDADTNRRWTIVSLLVVVLAVALAGALMFLYRG